MMKSVIVLSLVMVFASSGLCTTHTIVSSGFTFSPDTLTVNIGDTVQFSIASIHDAVEVSQTTWNADDTTSNGGFRVPFGGGFAVLTAPGIHYYVCQAHVTSMGMKGTITVNAAPPPNTITIRSIADQDGNLLSVNDRMFKPWSLKLYQDSVASGIVVDSVSSGDSLNVINLNAGTYVALEADSLSWSHISVSVDGISQGAVTSRQWSLTVTSGESHVIDFINFSPNTIISVGLTFSPDSITVLPGDRIQFVLDPMHNAAEVSQATWLANDTLSNGGFRVPFGGGTAILTTPGTHYYVCQAHAAFGMKGRIFVLPESSNVAVSLSYLSGWNLISLPVRVSDNSVTALFPSAVSRAFAYQGSYTPLTTMADGYGYWLKFNDTQSVTLHGLSLLRDSLTAQQGWNLIGSVTVPFPAVNLSSQPPGIISSVLFGFNGSYYTADSVRPGLGYWLKTSQAGELYLNLIHGAGASTASWDEILQGAGKLVIRDGEGNSQTLFVGDQGAETPALRRIAELPPVPPPGVFDARFSSGFRLQEIGMAPNGVFPIQISSAVYPVTLTWNMRTLQKPVSLRLNGGETVLSGTGSVTTTQPIRSISLGRVSGSNTPQEYVLKPAFPDPFNPSTLIQYFLPVRSRVVLNVFNIIGQKITTLVNGIQDEGLQSVTWNAESFSSGIYIVEMTAVSAADGGKPFHRMIKVVLQR